ncbi:MAG TPA: ABC transporter substrate-binding protein [Geminicoccaceae bacterium]|nr:ABC transporter substrate-binding protein [Geminicoccaceae bacterium]
MRKHAILLAATLAMAPLGAKAADLVVWWQEGYHDQEDVAVRETIAAFEQGSGKRVELVFYEQEELPEKLKAALEAGRPPDFAFGSPMSRYISEWAFDDRLVDLTDTVGHFSDLFDPDALDWFVLLNRKTGQRRLYALPVGRSTNHVHVWKSLLEQGGFTLEDIPREWAAFWSFWCDRVQPAVRRVTGRDDLWGVGLNMSGKATDTQEQLAQFMAAYDADYVTADGRLVIGDPEIRRRLIEAIDAYTAVYRNGCTPPEAISWDSNCDNNEQFLAQAIVMVTNQSLSIPNALKGERPEDYFKNTTTIEWPLGPNGEAYAIYGEFFGAVVFKDGRNVDTAKEFVRLLVEEGWLAHYLDFAGERFLPPMPKLREGPLWLDPNDRHHMAAVMQIAARPMQYDYATVSGDWRHRLVFRELVWNEAVHRVAAEGISPEQAVDEALVRIKEILSE